MPAEVAFPEHVKSLIVTKSGEALILTPVERQPKPDWDSFFAQPGCPDFPDCDEPTSENYLKIVKMWANPNLRKP